MNAIDFWKGIDDRTAEITDAYNQATEENSCDYELCKACGGMCGKPVVNKFKINGENTVWTK